VCSEARPSILPVRLPEASRLSVPDLAEQRERKTTDRKGIFFSSFFLLPTHFSSLPLARLTECLNPSHFTAESNYSLGLTHWRRMETKTNPATLRRQPAEIKTGFQNWSAPRVDKSISRSTEDTSSRIVSESFYRHLSSPKKICFWVQLLVNICCFFFIHNHPEVNIFWLSASLTKQAT